MSGDWTDELPDEWPDEDLDASASGNEELSSLEDLVEPSDFDPAAPEEFIGGPLTDDPVGFDDDQGDDEDDGFDLVEAFPAATTDVTDPVPALTDDLAGDPDVSFDLNHFSSDAGLDPASGPGLGSADLWQQAIGAGAADPSGGDHLSFAHIDITAVDATVAIDDVADHGWLRLDRRRPFVLGVPVAAGGVRSIDGQRGLTSSPRTNSAAVNRWSRSGNAWSPARRCQRLTQASPTCMRRSTCSSRTQGTPRCVRWSLPPGGSSNGDRQSNRRPGWRRTGRSPAVADSDDDQTTPGTTREGMKGAR